MRTVSFVNPTFSSLRFISGGKRPFHHSISFLTRRLDPYISSKAGGESMKRKRDLLIAAIFLFLIAILAIGQKFLQSRAVAEAAGVQAPMFEVDPLWPKPLPNHWVQGMTIGVSADAQDHIWIIHRQQTLEPKEVYAITDPPGSSCLLPPPPVLEFDQAGNLIGHWGGKGQGYEWPESNHGITVDYKGYVWIGGNGRGMPPGGAARGGAGRGQGAAPDESQTVGTLGYF